MQYTIKAVSPTVKDISSQYGDKKVYRLKLEGRPDEEVVELVQKPTTQPPTAGQTIDGTIEHTQYGLKFKKDYGGGNFQGGQPSRGKTSGNSFQSKDDFTMYLSYAKDLAVALITKDGNLDKYGEYLDEIAAGGEYLHNAHKSGGTSEATPSKESTDVVATERDVIEIMGDGTKPDFSQIPF